MDNWESINNLVDRVKSKGISAVELVEKAIKKTHEAEDYNALISVYKDNALEKAKSIDNKIRTGDNVGRLAGVPFIAKDNFLTYGGKTTVASNMLRNYEAPYQATAIERLESEGAILVGKANLDAFACGSSTEHSDFGVVKNPHDKERVAGGSSGGSTAVVALGITPFSLGTDTGGSIRLPASFCGVVGYKPTYGLIPRYGVIAMASSLDVIGPIATNVKDASLVLDVMAGKDGRDGTAIDREESYLISSQGLRGKKFAVVKEYMEYGLEAGVRDLVKDKIAKLIASGAIVEEVSLPILNDALACYYIIMPAELSSNLARYDGIRYGYSSQDAKNLDETYFKSRSEGFNHELKRRIILGTYVLSSGYYDAYYKKAQLVRSKLISEFDSVLSKYDALVGPTSPSTAFRIGENIQNPLKMYLTDVITVAVNLAGVPAISIPIGVSNKMPVGLQLIGRQKQDKKLLEIALGVENI